MKKTIFEGSGVAIVTPFLTDGSVDYNSLKKLIEFQIESGTNCIITCGTTGESSTLSEKEHMEVIDYTVKAVDGRIPVIAGTGSNDTSSAIEMSKDAVKMGVDGLLLVTPYYNKTSQKGLIESYTKIANNVEAPIMLYNVPSRTGVNITPQTYKVLSQHPNIVATKEANGDISSVAKTASLCGDDLVLYSGNDEQTLPIMALGGKGLISVCANVTPKEVSNMCAALLRGDYVSARILLFKYIKLMETLMSDVNPIPVKEALHQMGYCTNFCRLPLTTMSDDGIANMTSVLKQYGLIK